MLISNLYASHYLFNHPCSKYYCRYDVYTNLYNYTGNHLIYNIVLEFPTPTEAAVVETDSYTFMLNN